MSGKDQIRIVFERVVHAIAVMRIDVHVRDALESASLAEQLHRNPAVVEHAAPGRFVAGRVMQAGYGDESVAHLAAHDGVRCIEGRADDVRRCFEHRREMRACRLRPACPAL